MSRPLNKSATEHGAMVVPKPADLVDASPEVSIIGEPAQISEEQIMEWVTLEHEALEATTGNALFWLLPQLIHFQGADGQVECLTVLSSGRLGGVAALQRTRWRWGLPLAGAISWHTDVFFQGVPLVSRHRSQGVLKAVLTGLRDRSGAKVVQFEMVPRDGATIQALRELAAKEKLGIAEIESFERAGLRCDRSFEDWFNDSFPRKRRKEYRRLRKRLSEAGDLVFEQRARDEPLTDWLEDFAALEEAGWKGARGTAMASRPESCRFLEQACAGYDGAGRLRFWRLRLDGRTIATLFALTSGRQAWLVKIAYDEALAKYSPGVLLILDVTERLLTSGEFDLVDSSAVPDHPMINHLWRDRIAMTNVLVATPGTHPVVFAYVAWAERARRRARQWLKATYLKYVKRGKT